MTLESVPWFIGGGAEHSPSVCRLLPYVATLGAEGVVNSSDLKVTPLAVPGAGIIINNGGAVILGRSAGQNRESYLARQNTSTTLSGLTAVPGGSGRSDLVVLRVMDPEFAPWTTPADPVVGPYCEFHVIEGVSAGTKSAAALNLGYSAIAIARLDRPAGSSVVNTGDIVDLRQIVISRQEREIEIVAPGSAVDNDAANGTYKTLAATGGTALSIPSWATTAVVSVRATGLAVVTAANNGRVRAAINGAGYTIETLYDENYGGTTERCSYETAGRISIPANLRGTSVGMVFQATRNGGTGRLRADTGSTVVFDVQFQERPE